ncbi:MAG TPA: hypothetical protein VNI55_11370 [Gaiellaceae bacterium]|nr:hypothetical protein [Gaiellaceae bacterium]
MELWSGRRLPFEPSGWLRLLRAELRVAVSQLEDDGESLLHALYASEQRDACDAENILFYNVGSTCFSASTRRGLRFERTCELPKSPRGMVEGATHYHRYWLAPRGGEFISWQTSRTTASWEAPTLPLTGTTKPATVWLAVKRGTRVLHHEAREPIGRFGLRLRVGVPSVATARAITLVKPILDGVISAFHTHDGSTETEVVKRLATQTDADEAELTEHLRSSRFGVLGRRRLLHLRGSSIQWNPADDHCVACELLIQGSDGWSISGDLFEVVARQ